MSLKQNFAIKGYFGYEIYDVSGNLKRKVSNIPNFITSTGLGYPATYNFADCFRFISLGSGTEPNTILGSYGGTTGLSQPLDNFSYIGSRTSFSDINSSQYSTGSCGFRELPGQVTLSRGWKIPTGADNFDGNYSFKELMLTPGKPTGIAGLCGCNQGDITNGGVDASIVADYYDNLAGNKSICNANKAFTRIIPSDPIDVNIGDYVIITYDLNLVYDTGINQFNININNNFSPYWSGAITGSYNLLHHGVSLVNDGDGSPKSNYRNQITNTDNNTPYYWAYEVGESFVPYWGSPLEPSTSSANLLAYLSTDNVNFLVNQFNGGYFSTGDWQPYNPTGHPQSSGLMAPLPYPTQTMPSELLNIRTDKSYVRYPNKTDILNSGPPNSDINYIYQSFSNKNNFMLSFVPSGRSRSIIYPFVFTNLNSFNWANGASPPPLVRSMVLNYSDANARYYNNTYPFLDLLFSGISGEGIPATGEWYYEDLSTNYYPLGNGGDLTLSFLLTWSSPCDGSVVGC